MQQEEKDTAFLALDIFKTTFHHFFVGLLFASARKGCKRTAEEISALPAEVVSKRSRVSLALAQAGVQEGRTIQEAGLAN
jgi:hypothetical protein